MAKRTASHMMQKRIKLAKQIADARAIERTRDAYTLTHFAPTIATKAAAQAEADRLCEGVPITPCDASTVMPRDSMSVMGSRKRTIDKRTYGNGKRITGSKIVWANLGTESILLRKV